MTASKHVTLSDDSDAFGNEFHGDVSAVNDRLETAAEAAGVRCVRNVASFTDLESAGLVDDGSEEVDWFSKWSACGYRYNTAQWTAWFRKQVSK